MHETIEENDLKANNWPTWNSLRVLDDKNTQTRSRTNSLIPHQHEGRRRGAWEETPVARLRGG